METELKNLVARYGDAELRSALKKMHIADSSKSAKLVAGFTKVLEDVGTISFKRFKKEAAAAWKRAYPDGVDKKPVRGYQLFVKESMPQVIAENPGMTHSERMAVIGRLWKEHKTPVDEQPVAEPEPEQEPEQEREQEIIQVPSRRTRRSKKQE